jgi:hypothetical protein
MVDNIDLGKTHEYFKWVAKEYAGEGRVKGRPRFVMKADDDVGVGPLSYLFSFNTPISTPPSFAPGRASTLLHSAL